MGCAFSEPNGVLICGLPNSGKATVRYQIVHNNLPQDLTAEKKQQSMVFHDSDNSVNVNLILCKTKTDFLNSKFLKETKGIVFVVDSVKDRQRVAEGKNTNEDTIKQRLRSMLLDAHLSNVPILIFANKQDQSDAMSAREIEDKLGLREDWCSKNHKFRVVEGSAVLGKGVRDGWSWLARNMAK